MASDQNFAARIALHLTDDTGAERQLGIGPFRVAGQSVEQARDRILAAIQSAEGVTYSAPAVELPRRRSRPPEPQEAAPVDSEAPAPVGTALDADGDGFEDTQQTERR